MHTQMWGEEEKVVRDLRWISSKQIYQSGVGEHFQNCHWLLRTNYTLVESLRVIRMHKVSRNDIQVSFKLLSYTRSLF